MRTQNAAKNREKKTQNKMPESSKIDVRHSKKNSKGQVKKLMREIKKTLEKKAITKIEEEDF